MPGPQRTLALLLRIVGLAAASAVVPAFMPFQWMAAIHQSLGMGQLPDVPVVHYLARSVSLLYAAHGAVLVYVSCDVRRYLPALKVTALVLGFCGISIAAIDFTVGMPMFWTLAEGPFLILAAIVTWKLANSTERNLPLLDG